MSRRMMWSNGLKAAGAVVLAVVIVVVWVYIDSMTPAASAKSVTTGVFSVDIKTIAHDDCEYVVTSGGKMGGIAHKGNCRFCDKRDNGIRLLGDKKK